MPTDRTPPPRPDGRTRRRLLAGLAAGLAGGAAGCVDMTGGEPTSPGEDRVSTYPEDALGLTFGREFSRNGIRARPMAAGVQGSFHYRHEGGADVHAAGGRQFAFVELLTGNSPGIDPPRPADFAMGVGAAGRDLRRGWTTHPDVEGRPVPDEFDRAYAKDDPSGREETDIYGGEGQQGWIGFELPATVEGPVNLVLEPTEAGRPFVYWPLPEDVLGRLRPPPPSFAIPQVSLPESVPPGDPIEASVTAENAGEGTGTCRVVLLAEGEEPELGGVSVPAGETRTWTGTVAAPEEGDAVEVVVRTAPRDVTREVRLE